MRTYFSLCVVACLIAAVMPLRAQTPSGTTVLTFDIAGFGSGVNIPQDYGDNVGGPVQGNYSYGGSGAFTPNVVVNYELLPAPNDFWWWSLGYGDLQNVMWGPSATTARISLTADPGFLATLQGLDLGAWSGLAVSIPQIQVRDENLNILFTQSNVALPQSTSAHLDLDFSPTLSGHTLTFEMTLPPSGMNNIGIDNFDFGQSLGLPGVGQANSTQASLVVNNSGLPGFQGPIALNLPIGGTMTMDWSGPANAPLLLIAGPPNPGGLSVPCLGSVDVGTPPFYADVVAVFNGALTTLPDSLFRLDALGLAQQTFSLAGPLSFSIQGAVFQPGGSGCGVVLTTAFDVSVN